MAFDPESSDAPVTSINVTPLVDVVLVLLVVLMVAASGAISEALPLDLPSASTGGAESSMLRIGIAADGALSVDGQVANLGAVRSAAERAAAGGREARAAIAADGAARHQRVIEVIDTLRSCGINRLAFQVSPKDR